ncbi:hypothetical protein [Nocardia salmonicida]|uniref:hypothetical protein n=1 Tax=Nocardia salmonicida TaxID=53431 RepID=UPI000AB80FFB|nr:hypothetical protein [Nocardia salmonicida]
MSRSVPQPPFPSELLADLHADNLAPEVREQLWPVVRTDVDALHYLNKLDEVNTHLRTLATDERVTHRMPDDVADRMFRFVAQLDAGDGPTDRITPLSTAQAPSAEPVSTTDEAPVSLDRYRSRRRLGLLAAAAATVAVLAGAGAVFSTFDTTEGTPTAAPFTEPAAADELTTAAALRTLGKRDVIGPLADDAALTRCVQANGIDRAVLGASNITFRGSDAVLVLVQGAEAPTITALVVGTGCTTGAPEQLTLRDIG